MPYTAVRYQKRDGRVPYAEWMKLLQKKDVRAAAKIDISINRARAGNFGDHKFERDGVWALRIHYGPGYRVYYSVQNGTIILLLVGGDKKSQQSDLNSAVDYLKDYEARKNDD